MQVNLIRKDDHIPAVMVGQIPGGPIASGAAALAEMPANGTNGLDAATAQARMEMEEVSSEADWTNGGANPETESEETTVP